MSKKPIIGGIILAVIIGVVFVGAQINPDNPDNIQFGNSDIFHVTLADPALYEMEFMLRYLTLKKELMSLDSCQTVIVRKNYP